MPKVSVIIPVYNRAQVLSCAIKSVLSQTFHDFELIVVDDCSTDNVEDVIKSVGDSRIVYLRLPARQGAAAARNAGIHRARGEYVAFLDSDDEWLPEKLKTQVAVMKSSPDSVGGVFTAARILPSQRYFGCRIPLGSRSAFRALLKMNVLGSCSLAMLRRSCFDTVGVFDPILPASQDYDLWVRITRQYEIKVIAEPLVRIHAAAVDRITKNLENRQKAQAILNDKLKADLSPIQMQKRMAHQTAQAGYLYFLYGDTAHGRCKAWEGVRMFPFSLKVWLYAFSTVIDRSLLKKVRGALRNYEPLE